MQNHSYFLSLTLKGPRLLLSAILILALGSCGPRTSPVKDVSEVKDLSLTTRAEVKEFYGFYTNTLASLSNGVSHTCLIDDEGVKCWGLNEDGQTNVPAGLKNPKLVSSGH